MVRNIQDNDFNKFSWTNINSTTSKTQAVNDNHVITGSYVDQFHQNNERSRRDLGIDFYGESKELVEKNPDNNFNDNKSTNLDSTQSTEPPFLKTNSQVKNMLTMIEKIYTILTFNKTLENYLRVSVVNIVYKFTKYDKIQITDTTIIINGNSGGYLLPLWKMVWDTFQTSYEKLPNQ